MPDFLLEIGCEEIPARMIDAASQELRERVSALLALERLAADEVTTFDTPRRLALIAAGLAAAQADVVEQLTGPSVNVAYKEGRPMRSRRRPAWMFRNSRRFRLPRAST